MGGTARQWAQSVVAGTDGQVLFGLAGTAGQPEGHRPQSFYGPSTIILGWPDPPQHAERQDTAGRWGIPLRSVDVRRFTSGYLVVGCVRYFGGLHSRVFDGRVEVEINGQVIDGFGLRKRHPDHSDFFHRQPMPDLGLAAPLDTCQTLYAWPITRDHLVIDGAQHVTLRIDRDTRWDVDFVGIVHAVPERSHDVFLSHSWNDKPMARQLAGALEERGVAVWVDDAEMHLGDSLIEKIGEAILSVEYLVAMLSRASVSSEWVSRELEIAINEEIEGRRVVVLPVLVEDCQLPPFLRGKLRADLRSLDNLDRVADDICARVLPA